MNLQRTPFDLNWRMFGIPVRVHPSFWLIAALFAGSLLKFGIHLWLIGIGCMFVSLLAHEMAHALGFQFFGTQSSILCYSFGGLTFPEGRLPLRSQRIAVTLAGPFANFAIAGLVWASNAIEPWALTSDVTVTIYWVLFSINIAWGILNLLPVHPLDGGQVSRELWVKFQGAKGLTASLQMSFVVAIAIAGLAFACEFKLIPPGWIPPELQPGLFAGLLFALLAAQNYVDLRNQRRSMQYYDDRSSWR